MLSSSRKRLYFLQKFLGFLGFSFQLFHFFGTYPICSLSTASDSESRLTIVIRSCNIQTGTRQNQPVRLGQFKNGQSKSGFWPSLDGTLSCLEAASLRLETGSHALLSASHLALCAIRQPGLRPTPNPQPLARFPDYVKKGMKPRLGWYHPSWSRAEWSSTRAKTS